MCIRDRVEWPVLSIAPIELEQHLSHRIVHEHLLVYDAGICDGCWGVPWFCVFSTVRHALVVHIRDVSVLDIFIQSSCFPRFEPVDITDRLGSQKCCGFCYIA